MDLFGWLNRDGWQGFLSNEKVKCLLAAKIVNKSLHLILKRRLLKSLSYYMMPHPDRFTREEMEHDMFRCLEEEGCFILHDEYTQGIDLNKTDCATCKRTLGKIKDIILGEDVQENILEFNRLRFGENVTSTPITSMLDENIMNQVQRVEQAIQNGDHVSTEETEHYLESTINIIQTVADQQGLPTEIQEELHRNMDFLIWLKDVDLDVFVFEEANPQTRNRQRMEHRDMFKVITNSNLGVQSLCMECTCC